MLLSVAVMVSVDRREVYELLLPGISERVFRGVSLAELLDDVALYLMEAIPQESASRMVRMQFCPHVELRRVKVRAALEVPGVKKKVEWSGRVTAVLTRWPEDNFTLVRLPRVGLEGFAIDGSAHLEEGIGRFLEGWASRRRVGPEALDALVSGSTEYLEILQVDAELPTVLPSRPPPTRKRSKKPHLSSKKGRKPGEGGRKRRLVAPTTLRQVSVNLSHRAMDDRLGRTFGRDGLVEQVMGQLAREGAAVLLVGPTGVGKTAIVHEIVRRMAEGERDLFARRDVWSVDGNRIIAGMSMVGAWEQRCERMVAELSARQDLLYVDDLPSLVYTGRSAHSDTNVAGYLEPHLARGELRIIGECTAERLEATREEAPGFFARFHVVQVPELSERDTLMVLVQAVRQIEAREEVVVEPEVLEAILALTRRFMVGRCHPGKAIELLRQLVTDHRDVERDGQGRRQITRGRLVEAFGQQTGLPDFVLWERQSRRHGDILAHFERRIVAQPAASLAVTDVVVTLQQGLNDPSRPLCAMLFVGPTGVGKTETAKALAEFLFGGAERLIRFDMSEFRDPWSVARLFGDRQNPEGELTRRVAQQPFGVVLFDEIEKADPSVYDALLQVLGEGRLTNAAGRTTDFCNTVLIMTSNLGVRESQRSLGFVEPDGAGRDAQFRKAAEGFFRPEFFNRIDRIVAFRALGREAIAPLVRRLLQDVLGRRGLRRSGVLVQVEPELVDLLVDQGFEPRYGARSLKRALEQRLTVPLAQHLVTQPVDRTTLVHLYRSGAQIGMEIHALEDRALPERALEAGEGARGWAAIEGGYAEVAAQLEALRQSPRWSEAEALQGALLSRFNEGSLDLPSWASLGGVSALVQGMRALEEGLASFEDEFLSSYKMIEGFEVIEPELVENRPRRPTQAPAPLAVAVDRGIIAGRAREALAALEVEVAALRYRCAVIHERERPQLVRLMPATDDDSTICWAGSLAAAFWACWGRWADVRPLYHMEAEGWCWAQGLGFTAEGELAAMAGQGGDLERLLTIEGAPIEGLRAFALEVRGAGMGPLIGDEVGFHMTTKHLGPDLICDLVRLEEVGAEGVEAIARLSALDEAQVAWRAARLAGAQSPNPLGPMPIVRRFEGASCSDPETGLAMDATAGPESTLGQGLFEVMTRRLWLRGVGSP